MSNSVQATYTGGLDEVHVYFPSSGRSVLVKRGETIDVLPGEAEALSAEWKQKKTAAKKKEGDD